MYVSILQYVQKTFEMCDLAEKNIIKYAKFGKGHHEGQTALMRRKEKIKLIYFIWFCAVYNFVVKKKNRRKNLKRSPEIKEGKGFCF